MFWWHKQSKGRKILILLSLLALSAGISAGGEALIGGVFLFLVFFTIAFVIPQKPGNSVKQKEWRAVLSPHLYGKEKWQRITLAVLAICISLTIIYLLFFALIDKNYSLALLYSLILIASTSSLVYLFPRLYNEIFLRSKIIPLKKKMNTKELCEKIAEIRTPYGIPLLETIQGLKEKVAVYRIVDLNWIVYFYVHENEVFIHAKALFNEEIDLNNTYLIYIFTQQLSDLICFYVNTGRLPDKNEVNHIFSILNM